MLRGRVIPTWVWWVMLVTLSVMAARADTVHEAGVHVYPFGQERIGPLRFIDLSPLPCPSGTETYISNASQTNPCTSGGTGAWATCIAGVWSCTAGASSTGGAPGGVSGDVQVNNGAGGFGVYPGTGPCAGGIGTLSSQGVATCNTTSTTTTTTATTTTTTAPVVPGGADTNVQFNDAGVFGGNSRFLFNKTTRVVTIGGGGEATATELFVDGTGSSVASPILDIMGSSSGGVLRSFPAFTGAPANFMTGYGTVTPTVGPSRTNELYGTASIGGTRGSSATGSWRTTWSGVNPIIGPYVTLATITTPTRGLIETDRINIGTSFTLPTASDAWAVRLEDNNAEFAFPTGTTRGVYIIPRTSCSTVSAAGTVINDAVSALQTTTGGANTKELFNVALHIGSTGSTNGWNRSLQVNNGIPQYKKGSFALANGVNDDIGPPTSLYMRITGPTAAFSVTSIRGGTDAGDAPQDGDTVVLYNVTTQAMTITNAAGTGTVANRIATSTGADLVTTGEGSVTLFYDSTSALWRDTEFRP